MAKHEWAAAREEAHPHYDETRRRMTVRGILDLAHRGASEDDLVTLMAKLEAECARVQDCDLDQFVSDLVDEARERAIATHEETSGPAVYRPCHEC